MAFGIKFSKKWNEGTLSQYLHLTILGAIVILFENNPTGNGVVVQNFFFRMAAPTMFAFFYLSTFAYQINSGFMGHLQNIILSALVFLLFVINANHTQGNDKGLAVATSILTAFSFAMYLWAAVKKFFTKKAKVEVTN